ncbi:MAG: DUF898 family protein [Aliishimia sp.]
MNKNISGRYYGESRPLFGLFIKTSILTVLTLGIYRFWAKTRIRKYFWSATTGDGDSFEYTGTGLEKFLGFLVAVVILAIYLGIVQMILFFFGISLFSEPQTQAEVLLQLAGVYIPFFAVVPLIFFAQYRSRRYKMARTRWRGLRFGMDSAAWGYVWRAILHSLLTILTLGILLPRQTFSLEKYMADRMWYGDAKFEQQGRWPELYKGMKHLVIALVIFAASITFGVVFVAPGFASLLFFIGYIWFVIGSVYYNVYAFNYMTKNKVLDAVIRFKAIATASTVVKIVLVGILLSIGFLLVVGIALAGIFFGVLGASFGGFTFGGGLILLIGFGGLFNVGVLLMLNGISLVFITQKIIAHIVDSVTVENAPHLDTIRQRAADKGADADGFADALDIGGAI